MASLELEPARTETAATELAYREAFGLKVQLLYRKIGNEVLVHLTDETLGEEIEFPVPNDKALDAFYHPNVYVHAEAA